MKHFNSSLRYSLFFLMGLFLWSSLAEAQVNRRFATTIQNSNNTNNQNNAVDGNLNTFATVRSGAGVAAGLGSFTGFVTIQFDQPIPANQTTFVRLNFNDDILGSLLNGGLGNLVANIGGALLFGNHTVSVAALNNGTLVNSASTGDPETLTSDRFRVLVDPEGRVFLAITPTGTYNQIRVGSSTSGLLGFNTTNTVQVFGAFTLDGQEDCPDPVFTGFNTSGLTLDALNLNPPVRNPQNAIDGNPNTFSSLSFGVLGVAGVIEQFVVLGAPSRPDATFNVRLRLTQSLLTAGVLNNVNIVTTRNGQVVTNQPLSNLLNVDLLGLLQPGQFFDFPVTPGVPVDRIFVRYNSLVNLSVAQSLDFAGVFPGIAHQRWMLMLPM
ncbi:hypothetical protein [Nitritalea halalkaliphila]|uniref:hypothetical protein n=1 Tax=Nitritalea halalkaliphila TaxID=590849 RepID=UPI0003099A9A|nr:hypothetical protein [Nitritalea halalkaliphila]